jgi:hypothetical protein
VVRLRVGQSPELLLQPYGMVELHTPAPGEVRIAVRVRGVPDEELCHVQGERQDVTVDWGDGPWSFEQAHIDVHPDEQVTCVEISLRELV